MRRGFAMSQGDAPYLIRTYAPRPRDQEGRRSVLNEGMLTNGADSWLIYSPGTAHAAGARQAFYALPGKVCV